MLGITGLNTYLILLTTLLTTLFSNHKVDKFFNQGYSLALIDMSVEIPPIITPKTFTSTE